MQALRNSCRPNAKDRIENVAKQATGGSNTSDSLSKISKGQETHAAIIPGTFPQNSGNRGSYVGGKAFDVFARRAVQEQ